MKHTHFKSWFTLMIGCLFFMNVQPLLASGDYLTGLPFIAGANTVVYNGEIHVYPEQELKEKVEGIVMLSLTCDKEGKVIGCKIIEQATTTENENLREEALRLANLAKWVEPGVMYMVHISFDIEDYLKRNMH